LFLSTEEYWDLLKSKTKSVQTVDLVIASMKDNIEALELEKSNYETLIDNQKSELTSALKSINHTPIDIDAVNRIDDKTLAVKSEIQSLEKKLEYEKKLDEYKRKLEDKTERFKQLDRDLKILSSKAESEMDSTVLKFNTVYNDLMTNTLKNCRSASIDSDSYEPVVDGGFYREASSRVATRLNYFLSMLLLSLEDESIKFPRFLMIDTPQTAGIDPDELKKLLSCFSGLDSKSYQVILTTGVGLYPDELKPFLVESLSDTDKLLKPR
jgi:DNA repair exonuclease SbcCD ATPase subunit